VPGKTSGRGRLRAPDLLRLPFAAVVDFLVEDGCLLCRRPHPGRVRKGAAREGPARYLIDPVPVRCLFGAVVVENQPVCAGCAASFVETRGAGVLPGLAGTLEGARSGGGPVAVVSPFMTTDGVLEIIHQLKFNGYQGLADPVARAMAWALRRYAPLAVEGALIVPTPMDRRSQRRRGFNQAERIARALSRDLGVPLVTDVLRKTAPTQRQSLTPRERRAANVRGAFSCNPRREAIIRGRSVVLVDDLAEVCAGALFGAGATSVSVASFGRAL
jgi:predicted amidophosphoribosyltransferase